jgi:hypothetical protein
VRRDDAVERFVVEGRRDLGIFAGVWRLGGVDTRRSMNAPGGQFSLTLQSADVGPIELNREQELR